MLISLGLAIIFGMMRIINLAHGEFLMLGAYATVLSTNHGVNIWISMLVISPLFVGLVGLFVERTLIRFLYGRLVDTMLATWGLSLFIVGLVTTIFGNTINGVPTPLGGFEVGVYRSDLYTPFLAFVALLLLVGVIVVMRYTRFGLIARATMQNPNMASALGVNPTRVYMATFGIGAAVTGLAGGLLAPVSGVAPTMGSAFVAKAFITVVGGGAVDPGRDGLGLDAVRLHQPDGLLPHDSRLRRGDPARRRHRPDPHPARRHHRALLQG